MHSSVTKIRMSKDICEKRYVVIDPFNSKFLKSPEGFLDDRIKLSAGRVGDDLS